MNETVEALIRSFGKGEPHLDVGIFGTTYVFDVLRAHDRDDVGLALLGASTHPSLGYMIAQVKPSPFACTRTTPW